MSALPAATLEELAALCRRLRLRYIREQAPDVLLTAKAQRWDPAELLRVLLVADAERAFYASCDRVADRISCWRLWGRRTRPKS